LGVSEEFEYKEGGTKLYWMLHSGAAGSGISVNVVSAALVAIGLALAAI
jgi:hypothetical protein